MTPLARAKRPNLPPRVVLNHPEAFEIWELYRAFDRRFLPSQLLQEPDSWLSDMLTLDHLFESMKPEV